MKNVQRPRTPAPFILLGFVTLAALVGGCDKTAMRPPLAEKDSGSEQFIVIQPIENR